MKIGFVGPNGVDLGELFQPISAGDQKVEDVGFVCAGQDISAFFARRTGKHPPIMTNFKVKDGRDLGEIFEPRATDVNAS
ncbi:hypothetical protein [Stenotrophomonas maltophilia]|uniref:hypothetical protein n=1 Tax=Stenotrophomonas maltophilia TaxID=40324 RepID=UPI000AF47333|nr:hypothetical protein [Stenotrophomonas maltophilia]